MHGTRGSSIGISVPQLGSIRLQDLKALDVSTYYASLKAVAVDHRPAPCGAVGGVEGGGGRGPGGPQRRSGGHGPAQGHAGAGRRARPRLECAGGVHVPRRREDVGAATGRVVRPGPRQRDAAGRDRGAAVGRRRLDDEHDPDRQDPDLPEREPEYGLPKTKAGIRTIDLSPDTMALLESAQAAPGGADHAEPRRRIRTTDWSSRRNGGTCTGARTRSDCHSRGTTSAVARCAGWPKAAGVRRIKFHGLRHTMATLMLFDRGAAPRRAAAARP